MRIQLMSKATHGLSPAVTLSKPDTRATSHAAYGMARRMIRDRATHGTGAALTWYLDHGFRRFGFSAMPIVRAAGWAVFNQVHVSKAATGTPAELARQGMLTRCVRLERAPWGGGARAGPHAPWAAVTWTRGSRVPLARQRRAVARAMAEDRLALAAGPVEERFAITPAGVAALREAEAARATA